MICEDQNIGTFHDSEKFKCYGQAKVKHFRKNFQFDRLQIYNKNCLFFIVYN